MSESYQSGGQAWLVCPKLLELDKRHGTHTPKWPECWHQRPCLLDHTHDEPVADGAGHRTALFIWQPGSDHINDHIACTEGCHDTLRCGCGETLVYSDLDDPR
jgi:hypothetical protein